MKKEWIDSAGNIIPVNRVTQLEKKKERYADRIVKAARKTSDALLALKNMVETASQEIYQLIMNEKNINITKKKGNYTWFNFDRSVKVEIDVSDKITFDDLLIYSCKTKLDSFLSTNITTEDEFIKQLVLDAFQTTNGRLDTKRVMGLLKYRSKIKDELFQSAMDDLENSIVREFKKKYSRIWLRQDDGSYKTIALNYSEVK